MNRFTNSIHVRKPDNSDSHYESISMTAAYDFYSAEEAYERFSGSAPGNVYSRFTNPTVDFFEKKLAAYEQAEAAISVSSGMAAYLIIAMTYLKQGDHVILASGIFGTTTHLYRQYFSQFGITATSVSVEDLDEWQNAIRSNTKMFIVESPTNPLMHVADLESISLLASHQNALFIVDNTLLSPIFQSPLSFGADLVLHSAGKFIDGQGRSVGGIIAGSQELISPLKANLRSSGVCISPFNAWIMSHGLDTLRARMLLHEKNTRNVYNWLKEHSNVNHIYTTLNPQHQSAHLIEKQQSGHAPILTLDISGGKNNAWKFINSLSLISRCTNIGAAKTMITHPTSTTHLRYTDKEKEMYGLTDGLVRICIGLEDYNDIIYDIKNALELVSSSNFISLEKTVS